LRNSTFLLLACLAASSVVPIPSEAQKPPVDSEKIRTAKTIYFDDRTNSDAVGNAALAQLKKWARFQIVEDRHQADLIFLLSESAYRGGYIVPASGSGESADSKPRVKLDPVSNSGWHAPVRACFLTVIDPRTGENLWSDSHVWGGVLTGKNSAGERVVKELQGQMKK
jgi:outer membrane protein assembly factor BamB